MNILIIGAGAYGLALSSLLSEKSKVTVYSSLEEEINNLKKTYKNEKLFPNITLPKKVKFINKIEKEYEIIILALPANIIEQELQKIKNEIKNTPIIIASKGTYNKKFLYEIVKNIIKSNNIYVLSGPSFAKDVIEKQPITLTLAGKNNIKNIFPENITLEYTEDIIGTEICGTLKNIYAIGSGMLEGMNLSESTKASYLTKVLNEMKNIIINLNGNEKTILNSCGIGDTILTCSSINSRNYKLGYMVGKKENIEEYIKTTTIEGINSLKELKQVLNIKKYKIIDTIYNIIYNKEPIEKIIEV